MKRGRDKVEIPTHHAEPGGRYGGLLGADVQFGWYENHRVLRVSCLGEHLVVPSLDLFALILVRLNRGGHDNRVELDVRTSEVRLLCDYACLKGPKSEEEAPER